MLKWRRDVNRQEKACQRTKLQLLSHIQSSRIGSHIERDHNLQKEIPARVEEEDLKWRQRKKQYSVQQGDRNTKFFHLHANQRRKTKKIHHIHHILSTNGSMLTEQKCIGDTFSSFYSHLFTSSNHSNIDEFLQAMSPRVTDQMNQQLFTKFTEAKFKAAIFHMKPIGAQDLMGFLLYSFEKIQSTIGPVVCLFVLGILNHNYPLYSVYTTFITLISKIKNVEKVKDFRSISFCNVVYKIVAKVLENRLKSIVPDIIFPSQSAFVPNRLIFDNTLIAYEVLHFMTSRFNAKARYMALKLDMSNAFDRIEWQFLEAILYKMGFHANWIMLLMNCISSVSYSILVNGILQPWFKPTRGIRHGDPLSPYFCIIYAEALTCLLWEANSIGCIISVLIASGNLKVKHLFFKDYSLLLCKANTLEWSNLIHILGIYKRALVNF